MNRNSIPEAMEVMVTPTTQNIDLDRLIVERKQEKQKTLREKLKRNVRIIRDRRKCAVNNEPFPKGAFQRLMINRIWETVFVYLTDPSDVTSAYFTCGPLGGILKQRRLLMWLPKALNIFKEKVDEAYDFKSDEMGKAAYQNWNAICSNARLVCKSWKKTIDIHANTATFNWLDTIDYIKTKPDDPRINLLIFDREEESVDKATSCVIKRGPPIRNVYIQISDDTTEQHFTKLLEYFKAHGSSVRFLRFEYCIYRSNGSGACERLFHVLKRVENLKKLDLVFYDGEDDDDDDDDDDEMMELEDADQVIPEGFNQYPLPALDSLEHFTCSNWSNKEAFVAQILRGCVNLRNAVLFGNDGEIFEDATCEALMGLRLERFSSFSTPFWFMSHQVTWPLKHLGISQSCGLGVIASLLVPAINRFRHTLEILDIYSAVKMDADARNIRFDLPYLKYFSIHVIRPGTLGLDYVLPLKSLEKITVYIVEYEPKDALVKMKRHLENGEMHKSNVWQCFPNLARFQKNSSMLIFANAYANIRPICYFRPTSS